MIRAILALGAASSGKLAKHLRQQLLGLCFTFVLGKKACSYCSIFLNRQIMLYCVAIPMDQNGRNAKNLIEISSIRCGHCH